MMMHFKYILVLVILTMSCGIQNEDERCQVLLETTSLSHQNVVAGNPVLIALKKQSTCDSDHLKIYFSGLGLSIVETINFNDSDTVVYDIPKRCLTKAGLLEIRFEGNRENILQLDIRAAEAEGIVDVFAGPKTIAADYHQPAMIVSIPKDEFGNPITAGSLVNYNFESQVLDKSEARQFGHLHSYTEIPLQEEVGKIYMSASSLDAHSKDNFLEIKPGSPANLSLSANQLNQFANEKENTIFQTEVINDKFGNQVIDGTKVHFTIFENNKSIGKYDAITIGGVAKVSIQNPIRAKTLTVIAHSMNAQSNALEVSYKNNVDDIPCSYNLETGRLKLGPIKGGLGNVVPDGFLIEITLIQDGKEIHQETGEIENGIYESKIKSLSIGTTLRINCGGIEKSIELQ